MRAAHPKLKPCAKGRRIILEIEPSEHVCSILGDFQKRYIPHPEANMVNAGKILILLALMDFERTMARAWQVEQYCNAEGIEKQQDYIEGFLKMKFPRGRVPRPKAAK